MKENKTNGNGVLVDISGIYVDSTNDYNARLVNYLGSVGNPYHFRVGDTGVKITHSNEYCLNQKVDSIVAKQILAT